MHCALHLVGSSSLTLTSTHVLLIHITLSSLLLDEFLLLFHFVCSGFFLVACCFCLLSLCAVLPLTLSVVYF